MGTLRNRYEGQVNKCVISSANGPFNRTSLFSEASVFKVSTHHERTCSSNQQDTLNNKRLLSTSSTDQAFGSSKSLSNTEITSQTSVLSSASCSSSSSILSSGCAMVLGKELSPGIKNGRQKKQNSSHSMDSPLYDDQNEPEKKHSTNEPPPIPPKTSSSNQNQINQPDSSPPALPTTPPPIHLNKSPDHNRTSMILDSIAMTSLEGDNSSSSGSFILSKEFRVNNKDKSNGKDGNNTENNTEHLDNSNAESIAVNEQVMNTSDLINAVIYIDDEDDLGSPTTAEEKSQ